MNKPLVDASFDLCRQALKSAVPPCIATHDTSTHYEVVADNGKEKHLFGYVVAHEHVITLGFNTQIPMNDLIHLVPKRLIDKMEHKHYRVELRDSLVDELANDIRDTCNKMLYYYNQKGWVTI